MDHKSFVAAIPAQDRARLTERSDRAGLLHLVGHAGAILACTLVIAAGGSGWWLALPVQGILIVFLFTLEHEATHKTPFASEALNEAVGRTCGLLLLLPFEWFRYFHLAHHRWTNIEGKDPELDAGKPETPAAWVWHVSGLPYWIGAARTDRASCARSGAGRLSARQRAAPDGTRSACDDRRLCRWCGLSFPVASAALGVDRPGAAGPARAAAVPAGRAWGLSARGEHVREHAHDIHHRR